MDQSRILWGSRSQRGIQGRSRKQLRRETHGGGAAPGQRIVVSWRIGEAEQGVLHLS